MAWSLSLLLLAGIPTADMEKTTSFENYTKAYHAARTLKQPMLVILNPSADSGKERIALEDIRRARRRRQLLNRYVVTVIDTGTKHGEACCQLFGKPKLPHVVVIDKHQKLQIFQTSEEMYGQLWTKVLETFQDGGAQPVSETQLFDVYCPT